MRKNQSVAVAIMMSLVLGVLAAPAAAGESERRAACAAIGGTFIKGSTPANDRCTLTTVTVGSPVATGTPTTSTIFNDLGQAYLSAAPVRVEMGEPVATTTTVHGDWAVTGTTSNATCSYAGKSKVQKCTIDTLVTESRDVFTITTITTPLYEVYEVLQDRQSVTSGAQPTTVTTTTRTLTYRIDNQDRIANMQSDVASSTHEAGAPIAIFEVGDVITVTVGEQQVATAPDVDVYEPVRNGVEVADPYLVSSVTCVVNGARQTVRDNSCPV